MRIEKSFRPAVNWSPSQASVQISIFHHHPRWVFNCVLVRARNNLADTVQRLKRFLLGNRQFFYYWTLLNKNFKHANMFVSVNHLWKTLNKKGKIAEMFHVNATYLIKFTTTACCHYEAVYRKPRGDSSSEAYLSKINDTHSVARRNNHCHRDIAWCFCCVWMVTVRIVHVWTLTCRVLSAVIFVGFGLHA